MKPTVLLLAVALLASSSVACKIGRDWFFVLEATNDDDQHIRVFNEFDVEILEGRGQGQDPIEWEYRGLFER